MTAIKCVSHRDFYAQNKKMDLILCASVSRFARDISDCVDHIRLLKTANPSHPVGVYFETEDIYTLDPTSDERLEMHAFFSGWECVHTTNSNLIFFLVSHTSIHLSISIQQPFDVLISQLKLS